MAEPSSSSVERPTTRSGAIYTNAGLLYELIESEVAHAIKPYQDALDSLQLQLHARNNGGIDLDTVSLLTQNAERAEAELNALKVALEESGIGVVVPDAAEGRPHIPRKSRLSPPATIVQVLVERDDLMKKLKQREAAAEAETARRDAEQKKLEEAITGENNKVVALTNALGILRGQAQSLATRVASAHVQSYEWKGKFETMEKERDALKVLLDTAEGNLDSARSNSAMWMSKSTEVEAAKDDSEGKLRTVQAEADEWKTKCLKVEAELKTVTDKTAMAQSDLDMWKTKCFAAEADFKTARDENDEKLKAIQVEVDEWKAKCLVVEADLKAAEDENNKLAGRNSTLEEALKAAKKDFTDWTAKGAAWDTERKRHKSQTARNAALISQLQSKVPELEAQLKDAEAERDSLKEKLQTDNAQSLAKNDASTAEVDEMKKKAATATANAKIPSGMFIKPRPPSLRPPLPPAQMAMSPVTSPQTPASIAAASPFGFAPSRRALSTPSASAAPIASTSSAAAPDSPLRTSLSDKLQPAQAVLTPWSYTESTQSQSQAQPLTQTQTLALGPVVGLNGRTSVRKNISAAAAGSSSPAPSPPIPSGPRPSTSGSKAKTGKTPTSQPRAPPPLAGSSGGGSLLGEDVLGTAPSLSRGKARMAPKEDGTTSPTPATTGKRPALASQSNSSNSTSSASTSTPKPDSQISFKRSAPSPLVSDRTKVPRTVADTPSERRKATTLPEMTTTSSSGSGKSPRKAAAAALDASSGPPSGFTRPPTIIPNPGRPKSVLAASQTPAEDFPAPVPRTRASARQPKPS
ncbi:hypothetical protein MVEN_00750400 [Mycena venus]|uniref:Uncharacterized protein n=1 Tax=Mycena venus TaxID=2733690 RepID=A0A8H6YL20_9AGAR|nr:hypothetical protein MVEN_00750400 [Mycena venus]